MEAEATLEDLIEHDVLPPSLLQAWSLRDYEVLRGYAMIVDDVKTF